MVFGFGSGGTKVSSTIESVNKLVNTATKNYLNRNSTDAEGNIDVLNELVASKVTFGTGCKPRITQKADVKAYLKVKVDQLSNIELANEVAGSFKDTFDNSVDKKQDFLGQGIETLGSVFGAKSTTETSTILKNRIENNITSNVTTDQIKKIVTNYDVENKANLQQITFDPCGVDTVAPFFKDDPGLLIEFTNGCEKVDCIIEQDIAIDAMTQDISQLIMSSLDITKSNIETEQEVEQSTTVEQDTVGTLTDFFSNPGVIVAIIVIVLVGGYIFYKIRSGGKGAAFAAAGKTAAASSATERGLGAMGKGVGLGGARFRDAVAVGQSRPSATTGLGGHRGGWGLEPRSSWRTR